MICKRCGEQHEQPEELCDACQVEDAEAVAAQLFEVDPDDEESVERYQAAMMMWGD